VTISASYTTPWDTISCLRDAPADVDFARLVSLWRQAKVGANIAG
jgi:hypothetical protein